MLVALWSRPNSQCLPVRSLASEDTCGQLHFVSAHVCLSWPQRCQEADNARWVHRHVRVTGLVHSRNSWSGAHTHLHLHVRSAHTTVSWRVMPFQCCSRSRKYGRAAARGFSPAAAARHSKSGIPVGGLAHLLGVHRLFYSLSPFITSVTFKCVHRASFHPQKHVFSNRGPIVALELLMRRSAVRGVEAAF